MKISLKRIKCILTGGCRFKSSDTESKCDDKEREWENYNKSLIII